MNKTQKTLLAVAAATYIEVADVVIDTMTYGYSNNLWLENIPQAIFRVGGVALGYNLMKKSRAMGVVAGYFIGGILGDFGHSALKAMHKENFENKQEQVAPIKQVSNVPFIYPSIV